MIPVPLRKSKKEQTKRAGLTKHAKIEIKLKVPNSVSDVKDEKIEIVYGTASYPAEPEILQWHQLLPKETQPPPNTPYIHLYEISGGETVADVCQQYHDDTNIKMLFIIADKKQSDLDSESMQLKGCHFTIIIIPRCYRKVIQDCLSPSSSCYAVISPVYEEGFTGTAFDIFLPKKPEEIHSITKTFQAVVQNRLIISVDNIPGENVRLMKYVLEETALLLKTETTEIYLGKEELSKILTVLLKQSHFDSIFDQDFLFYFNFICLIYSYQNLYSIGNLKLVIEKSVDKLMQIPTKLLEERLKNFIIKGNFELAMGGLESNVSIFQKSAMSCLEICEIRNETPNEFFSHYTILLISIAMKLCPQKEVTWQTSLIKHYKDNQITQNGISYFIKGLDAMSVILKDGVELMLGWKDVTTIFTNKIYSFTILRNFIAGCDNLLVENSTNNFFSSFMKPVISFYTSKKDSVLNLSDGTFIEEGLYLLSYLTNRKHSSQWEELLQHWVSLIVYLLDLNMMNDIQAMYDSKSWDGYHQCLNSEMNKKLINHCQEMSVDSFVAVLELGNFEYAKILHKFFEHLKYTKIHNDDFKRLLILGSKHMLSEKKYETSFFKFFEKILTTPKTTNQSFQLLLEVLTANIYLQFDIEAKFIDLLKNIIKSQMLQEEIYHHIHLIFDSLPKEKNSFCLSLMNIVIQEVFQVDRLSQLDVELLPSLFENSSNTDSVRFQAGISLLTHVSNFVGQSKTFSCLNDYSQILTSMAKSVCNIWNNYSHQSTSYTLEYFHESTKGVPGYYDLVKQILVNFKAFLDVIHKAVDNKNLTFGSLEILLQHFSTYEVMACCCTETIYKGLVYSKETELQSLKKNYNCNKEKLQNLLFRKFLNTSISVENILSKYGISIPQNLNEKLKLTFRPCHSENLLVQYEVDPNCTLATVESVTVQVNNFLSPFLPSLDTLVFVEYKNCEVLNRCINHFLSTEHQMKVDALNIAVQHSEKVVLNLINDCASIWIIKDIFGISNCVDLSKENEMLVEFYQIKVGDRTACVDISESFTSVSELFLARDYIVAMQKTFQAFSLDNFLNDPVMQNLIEIIEFSEGSHHLTTSDAKTKVAQIKQCLKADMNIINNPCFVLFSILQEHQNQNFYQFAIERGYNSTDSGMETFRQEHQLVTTELLHEYHDTELLGILQSAMDVIFPFFNEESDLLDLWNSLCSIEDISTATSNLKTVNEHISIIKEWFNKTHEETSENIKIFLESILATGMYHYSFENGHCVEISLNFHIRNKDGSFKKHMWPVDVIQDFTQKLKFVKFDHDSSSFKWFLELKKFAFELLQNYFKLQYNGHPFYLKSKEKIILINPYGGGWNDSWFMFESEIEFTKKLLKEFVSKSDSCRKSYPILSFVNSQKLKVLYNALMEKHSNTDFLLHLIGFLFEISTNSYQVLERVVKDLTPIYNESLYPTEIIGQFLEDLVKHSQVENFLASFISTVNVSPSKKDPFMVSLISTYNYTNLELVKLIYKVFDGFPWYFQLFRCSLSTVQEEIELFFDRIDHFPQPQYLILGIDLIGNELQQVFLSRCSKVKSEILSGVHKSSGLTIFFVEYSPSLFQHVTWISRQLQLEKKKLPSFDDIQKKCRKERIGKHFKNFEVIHGLSGSGKTHYIKNKIKHHQKNNSKKRVEVVSINENFTTSNMVQALHSIPLNAFDVLYYFNISLFMPHEYDKPEYKEKFDQLVHAINWFFFDYFVLGYVEIWNTCLPSGSPSYSLTLPVGLSMSIFIEVPYWTVDSPFDKFKHSFPCFALLGNEKLPPTEFDVDAYDGAQLVRKYLQAHEENNLDIPYTTQAVKIGNIYDDMKSKECSAKLKVYFPQGVSGIKIMEALYVKYMERRCLMLEKCAQLQYQQMGTSSLLKDEKNSILKDISTTHMRSTLLEIMKEEVRDFCDSSVIKSSEDHQQIIYDIDDNDGIVFKFFCTGIPSPQKIEQLRAIGAELEVLTTQKLHDYLSVALNIKKDPMTNKINVIKEKKFVLTKDFVKKMLQIHERKECGMPVIIEGETGVGKTFLLELLSSLWNDSWNQTLSKHRNFVKDCLKAKISKIKIKEKHIPISTALLQASSALHGQNNERVSLQCLQTILKWNDPDYPSQPLYAGLKQMIEVNSYDPVLATIEDSSTENFIDYLHKLESPDQLDEKVMAHVINGILYGTLKSMFYKKSIHAAMTTQEIDDFFQAITQFAETLQSRYESYQRMSQRKSFKVVYQKPTLTVFLDEINTTSCPGYLKEIIIDRRVNGNTLPENIFIVAACNPHRGNSLASVAKTDGWFNSSYYVQSLPHTLSLLKWNYEQLKEKDEREYIKEKFWLTYEDTEPKEFGNFVMQKIAKAQQLIRGYAFQHLKNIIKSPSDDLSVEDQARHLSQSTVSQRDIQRTFLFYSWLQNWFKKKYDHENDFQIKFRSLFIALSMVYYFRLNDEFRRDFKERIHKEEGAIGICGIPIPFKEALQDELDWVHCTVDFPTGIAPTDALKENIYATVVCTMACIPIIIVGPPGSSKTLSFKIVVSNFQGCYSRNKELRYLKALDPYPYQCSRKSTSHEIDVVFQRAKIHQVQNGSNRQAVVLMDEAGLPEDSHESLKVLHYLLENPVVSFVGITNEVLDAAKTNRAVSVYRCDPPTSDLIELAKYSLTCGKDRSLSQIEEGLFNGFVKVYEMLMREETFNKTFGLRDFIHFFTYLGQDLRLSTTNVIKPQSVVRALEHNFNGTEYFKSIVEEFFTVVKLKPENIKKRSLIKILQSSFTPEHRNLSSENQTRYKLLIDSSEDQSIIRLLFKFDVLERKSTKIISCSKLPGDGESLKLNATAAIRHSAIQGHTVVLYQAEEVQESFYDLFNQRFICIKTVSGEKLYSHVAVGTVIKPTRVDPSFNCAMILTSSEVKTTPKPFLNRFEKYTISHEVLFNEALSTCPFNVKQLLNYLKDKVFEFTEKCGQSSLYGFTDQTINSLLFLITPHCDTQTVKVEVFDPQCECYSNQDLFILSLLYQFTMTFGIKLNMVHCLKLSETVTFCFDSLPEIDDFTKTYLDTAKYSDLNEKAKELMEYMKTSSVDLLTNESVSSFTKCSLLLLREVLLVCLCNQLIQIMIPESLVINNDINSFFKYWYLHQQHHFSLGKSMNETIMKYNVGATKVICYTRTSRCILEMIPENLWCQTKLPDQEISSLGSFFHLGNFQYIDDCAMLHTYVIKSSTSQELLLKVFESFFNCQRSQVLLLVADMNRFSKEIVNQVRLLVEESEVCFSNVIENKRKSIYFILHFSSNIFYTHCYPTLFLEGWQHIYFDTIGEMQNEHCINIQKWLSVCFLEKPTSLADGKSDNNFVSNSILTAWLNECVPLISASITVRKTKDFYLESIKTKEIQSYWTKLLFTFSIDDIIKQKFVCFWQSEAINQISFHAANYATIYQWNSSLSERIQTVVRTSFTQVVLFLLHIINQQLALHTIFLNEDIAITSAHDHPVLKLFQELFWHISLPSTLDQLQLELCTLAQKHDSKYLDRTAPKFPFFFTVYEAIKGVLNKYFKTVVQLSMRIGKVIPEEIVDAATNLLQNLPDEYCVIHDSIKAMRVNTLLWTYYLNDAISCKFSRDVGTFSKAFFKERFDTDSDADDIARRLVLLHYYLHVCSIDSSELALLRSLDECVSDKPEYIGSCPDLKNDKSVMITVINVLFDTLTRQFSYEKVEQLQSSYNKMINCFSRVVLIDMDPSVKTKWNILYAVFQMYQLNLEQVRIEEFIQIMISDEVSHLTDDRTHLKVNSLADSIASIVFSKNSTSISLLSSKECPKAFNEILESIVDYYLKYLYDCISDEEANWIYHVINTIISFNHQLDWYKLLKLKFKYHLRSLLGKATNVSTVCRKAHPNPLLMFNDEMRKILGVLVHYEKFVECSEYYPFKILHASTLSCQTKNLLTLPLCDMYCELITDCLQIKEYNLSELIFYYKQISMDYGNVTCHESTKKLLLVEKQAVMNVVIKAIAKNLEDDEAQLADNDDSLNEALNDCSVVSKLNPRISCNALLLVMRILQVCKSESHLELTLKNDALFRRQLNGFVCLQPVNAIIKSDKAIHGQQYQLTLFLKKNFTENYTVFSNVHKSIKSAIGIVSRDRGIDELIRNAYSCCSNGNDKTPLFTMSVYLSIFIEFFQKRKTSAFVLPRLSEGLFCIDRKYCDFISWLADPNSNAAAQQQVSFSKLKHFFENYQQNEVHIQCILELVAVVLGSPENSSHFWTHLIHPNAVTTDIVPGCIVQGTDDSYLDVMSLNDDSISYTYRMSLNCLSLLMLQWMNYALLCMSMVVHPVSAQRLPLPKDALGQLELLWNKVALKSNLTYEERDGLMLSCVHNLYTVLQKKKLLTDWHSLSSSSEIQRQIGIQLYEQVIHNEVFLPAWKLVKSNDKFTKFGSILGTHMRELSKSFPYLNIQNNNPLEAFLLTVFTSTNLHHKSCQLYSLYQFIIARPALNIGAMLLPKLVEFYCWIHDHLIYKVDLEVAKDQSVEVVLNSVLEQFFPTEKKDKLDLIEEVIRHYKCYKAKISTCISVTIDMNMKFYDLLSHGNSQDVLLKVQRYNKFLDEHRPSNAINTQILLTEATEHTCTFGTSMSCIDVSDIKEIILKHHSVNDTAGEHQASDNTLLHDCVPDVFYLKNIQKEIIQCYIAHKQSIDMKNFRKEFEFVSYSNVYVPRNLFYTSSCYENAVSTIENDYPTLFDNKDCLLTANELEMNFHSVNYDCLLSICSGLYMIIKLLLESIPICGVEIVSNATTIQTFLSEICSVSTLDVLSEVGITRQSSNHLKSGLDDHHYTLLCDFQIKNVVFLSKFFQNWLDIGFYEFCHLPYVMKIQLSSDNEISLWIQQQGCDKVLKDTMHELFKSELKLIDAANEDSNSQIGSLVKDSIPSCVLTASIKYYVHIQLELRKKLLGLLKEREQSTPSTPSPQLEPSPSQLSPLPPSPPQPSSPLPPSPPQPEPLCNDPSLPPFEDICLEAAKNVTAEQMANFLDDIKLHEAAEIVRGDSSLNGSVLYEAMSNDDTLHDDLSITTAINRLRFRVLFKRLLSGTVSKVSPQDVANLCNEVEKLKEYAQKFIDNEIDGEMLLEAGTDVLNELGIKTLRRALLNVNVIDKIKSKL